FVLLAFGFAGSALAAPAIVLEGARLIDGTGKPVRDNAALVIQGDKITAVGTAGKLARPKGARVIDVHGRTIMPGLITAHTHTAPPTAPTPTPAKTSSPPSQNTKNRASPPSPPPPPTAIPCPSSAPSSARAAPPAPRCPPPVAASASSTAPRRSPSRPTRSI